MKIALFGYLYECFTVQNIENQRIVYSSLHFWTKKGKNRLFQSKVVYSSLHFVKSVIFDSKPYTNITGNKEIVSCRSKLGSKDEIRRQLVEIRRKDGSREHKKDIVIRFLMHKMSRIPFIGIRLIKDMVMKTYLMIIGIEY